MAHYILAIDQGTTNSRAIIFNHLGEAIAQHTISLTQFFPREGWVEQDPEEMIANTIACCRFAVKQANIRVNDIVGIGITNQRETTIIWNKQTGKAIYPAIVWQDRRTSDLCQSLLEKNSHLNQFLHEKTGLLLDPYFSASKILWILQNVPNAREQAERHELLFGTVDTFLLWKLTKQRWHVTDATNASRTLLFNIRTQQWDEDLLNLFEVPVHLLPRVLDNTAHFGDLDQTVLGKEIPITGVAGDQQASLVGQACFHKGMIKATYGTGCFMLLNTGSDFTLSPHLQLISTIAYRINHQVVYGLEGSIFSAGETIKWLRDSLMIIKTAAETENIAKNLADNGGVYLIPALTGLGAPYWYPDARGAIFGLTRNSKPEHIVRAALESVAYQTYDLLNVMMTDTDSLETLRVDGGMTTNNWLLQFLADMTNLQVQRNQCIETSALGAACLAGLQVGFFSSPEHFSKLSKFKQKFSPTMSSDQRKALYARWEDIIKKVLTIL